MIIVMNIYGRKLTFIGCKITLFFTGCANVVGVRKTGVKVNFYIFFIIKFNDLIRCTIQFHIFLIESFTQESRI